MKYSHRDLSGHFFRVTFFLLIAVWPLATATAAEQRELGANLADLMDYARAHNPQLAAMRHQAEAAQQREQTSAAWPDPVLRVELMDITHQGRNSPQLSPSQVGSTQYTLMQSVPWFGKRGLQRSRAEARVAQAEGQVAAVWVELSSKLKIAYAQYYYLAQSQQLIQEALALTGDLEQVAQIRYANGLGAQQEVIRMQIEKTDLQTELLNVQTEQHHTHSQLNGLLSRPAMAILAQPSQLRPLPPTTQLDYSLLEEKLRARNPQLIIADAQREEAKKNRDIVSRSRYPDLTLGIMPTQTGSHISEWGLMVEMSLPFQQGARRAQQREAEAMLAASEAEKVVALDQSRTELSERVASLNNTRHIEKLIATQLLPQAEATYQSALAGYQGGKVDFATLLSAQRQILKARQQHLRTELESQVLLAEIERLLGEEL